jgi:hypothetical protein
MQIDASSTASADQPGVVDTGPIGSARAQSSGSISKMPRPSGKVAPARGAFLHAATSPASPAHPYNSVRWSTVQQSTLLSSRCLTEDGGRFGL